MYFNIRKLTVGQNFFLLRFWKEEKPIVANNRLLFPIESENICTYQ